MKTTTFCLQVEDAGRKQSVPLQHPVSRVGHADYCEVQLKNCSAHAATIMVQSDHVTVINRTATAISCGKHLINPCQRHIWGIGQVLTLEGVRVTLLGAKSRNSTHKAVDAPKSEISNPDDAHKPNTPVSSKPGDTPTTSVSSSGSRRQMAVVMLCGAAMIAMLMGSRTVSGVHENKKKLDLCLSEIHTEIDTTRDHADIHSRLSSLVELINSVDGNAKGSQVAALPDAKVLAFCRSLAETGDPRVTREERQLAKQLVTLLNGRGVGLSNQQLRSLEQCLNQVFAMLEKHRPAAGVHSRMTTLADALYRCQSTGSQTSDALAVQRRDAITFCRSLAAAKLNDVTESERRLAKTLASLLEEGV